MYVENWQIVGRPTHVRVGRTCSCQLVTLVTVSLIECPKGGMRFVTSSSSTGPLAFGPNA